MMRKYGAGNHSKKEYQTLMSKLNTGMIWESPIWYDNFENKEEYNKWGMDYQGNQLKIKNWFYL